MKLYEETRSAQLIELSELQQQGAPGPAIIGGNLGLLQGVKVKVTVVVGSTETSLGELMALKELSILKIDRYIDQPVDVLVDGNVIARGQLVAIDENFGVRVTEIASAAIA